MIKLDKDTLLCIRALENISKVRAKDCIVTENEIIYIVAEDKVGQAVGKGGIHTKKIQIIHKKNVKIIGFSEEPVEFAKKIIGDRIEIKAITLETEATEKHIIVEADYKSHEAIRGKHSKKLKILKDLLKRHHNVADVILK
jgi:N utilization substance protein A